MFYVRWKNVEGRDCRTEGSMQKLDAELLAFLLVSYAYIDQQSVEVVEE